MNTPVKEPVGARLLIVDDDRLILAMLASGLQRAGYRVTTAESEDEAQELLVGSERPDLAILDVHLPVGSGLSLANRLREFDHIPFVMFSAYSDSATVAKATEMGALAYMVKPLSINQMVPTIEAALLRSAEFRELQTTKRQLQKALEVERDVNVAVGLTMNQYRLGREAAFNLLRNAARAQSCKLSEIATTVISASELLHKT